MDKIRIPRDVIAAAREFSKKVHLNRLNNKDKWEDGTEAAADTAGFFFEFACCHFFKQPFPKLFEGTETDKYDLFLKGKRIDAKGSKKCLVNVEQFERKKGKIDAFLFGETELLDFSHGLLFANFFGWIEYGKLQEISELVEFKNGTKAYKANPNKLRPVEELMEEFK